MSPPQQSARIPRLPADIASQMAEYGQARRNLEYEVFELGPFEAALGGLSPELQITWLQALAEAVLPAGGWALCGAQDTVMKAMGHPLDQPAYRAIMDAALEFQRAAGAWESELSPNEMSFWQERNPGEVWLEPNQPPTSEAALITPLGLGEERLIAALTSAPDSKTLYVVHAKRDEYVWGLDYPDESLDERGRLREQRGAFGGLFELYWTVGQNSRLPSYWVDPEFEPFLPFPLPRL